MPVAPLPNMPAPHYDTDVCIAGGSAAGLATAIACALAGHSVTVLDAATPPIDKACGEGLMPDALGSLRALGIAIPDAHAARLTGIRFLSDDARAQACFPHESGCGMRRTLLHSLLRARAQELDVRLLWDIRITGLDADSLLLDAERIRARWIVGADGANSPLRRWAGLDRQTCSSKRIGLRMHYRTQPWSSFVEVHWANFGQAYVTPIAEDEVCIAFLSDAKLPSIEQALDELPELRARLHGAALSSSPRGALSADRRLRRVTRENLALVGDASGSVDAITGEGLALSFRQAIALAQAITAQDLAGYERAHRKLARAPAFMSSTLLLLDHHPRLRCHALRTFAASPQLFESMLRVHIGDTPLRWWGSSGVLPLGWQLLCLNARSAGVSDFQ